MTAPSGFAAQYIRMSTDKQDLSPATQKEAIAAYAAARGLQIVASYEDEGRSGVHLKNRPALLKLLQDVTTGKQFASVLVYDVSRWGRFQDTDAAAYYEYHCRLHGAEVIYVAEMFGAEVNPITAMLKSMKRAMAAEYSRDLANKTRAGQHQVISRGYQIGPLPPLGYRRCSVSADGQRRVVLDDGQRKLAATDRIEWVLAPQEEVALVRRICDMYARTRLSFADIARLGSVEDWRDHHGRPLTGRSIATLIRNEALIGNFVWGRGKQAKRLVTRDPSRGDGCIPRLIDEETWARIQRRATLEGENKRSEELAEKLKRALERNPLLVSREFRAQGLPDLATVRARLGPWAECLKRAGQDPAELKRKLITQARQHQSDARTFAGALTQSLVDDGHVAAYDRRMSVLNLHELRIRLRFLWPTFGELGRMWRIRVGRLSTENDFDLLVRMKDRFQLLDLFLVPPADVVIRFPQWLTEETPTDLARFRCESSQQLLERIGAFSQRSDLSH
jgi:DNA invertase Pin-like site-specific DNA recombinase